MLYYFKNYFSWKGNTYMTICSLNFCTIPGHFWEFLLNSDISLFDPDSCHFYHLLWSSLQKNILFLSFIFYFLFPFFLNLVLKALCKFILVFCFFKLQQTMLELLQVYDYVIQATKEMLHCLVTKSTNAKKSKFLFISSTHVQKSLNEKKN